MGGRHGLTTFLVKRVPDVWSVCAVKWLGKTHFIAGRAHFGWVLLNQIPSFHYFSWTPPHGYHHTDTDILKPKEIRHGCSSMANTHNCGAYFKSTRDIRLFQCDNLEDSTISRTFTAFIWDENWITYLIRSRFRSESLSCACLGFPFFSRRGKENQRRKLKTMRYPSVILG